MAKTGITVMDWHINIHKCVSIFLIGSSVITAQGVILDSLKEVAFPGHFNADKIEVQCGMRASTLKSWKCPR